MPINPLLKSGHVFDLDLMNPNPSSSKTKDGPKYRVSFEVDRDTWDWFMEADTSGMMIAAKAAVYADIPEDCSQEDTATETAKTRDLVSVANELHKAGFFRNPLVYNAAGSDADYQAWVRRRPCAVCGEYDWNDGVRQCEYAHVRRVSRGAGVSVKPEYSGIPLCHQHHVMQHSMGEKSFFDDVVTSLPARRKKKIDVAREWFEVVSTEFLSEWCKEQIKSDIGVSSMSEASADDIVGWARYHDIISSVPQAVSDIVTPPLLRGQAY